jgi:hypothetical protein
MAALGSTLAVTACSAISGLGDYSGVNCPASGCGDATTHTRPDGQAMPEGSTDDQSVADVTTLDETSNDETGSDASPSDDAADAPAPDDAGVDAPVQDGGQAETGTSPPDASVPCPAGGCPTSTATSFSSCPFGSCNGSTTSACTTGGGCYCITDSLCLSGKCVKVTGENDQSCGSNCTGSGSRDGFNCELASPGIPEPAGTSTYSCPADSGYRSSTLTCDPTHTNCYCNADSQCPSGKCVPSTDNGNCSGCSGTGTADYRGCVATTAIPECPIYIGCPGNTTCSYPVCYCTSDAACESGHCIPSGHNGNCSGCTGTGTDDGHGCQPPPSAVACASTGSGSSCTTSLTPTPVLNSGKTACLCVADSDCASHKCVNANSQCTGTCTGSGSADTEDCETATSVPLTWSCSSGNCQDVKSPSGTCSAAGVPCWCTSDAQCPDGARCANWVGCASEACTGSGTGNAFNCVY